MRNIIAILVSIGFYYLFFVINMGRSFTPIDDYGTILFMYGFILVIDLAVGAVDIQLGLIKEWKILFEPLFKPLTSKMPKFKTRDAKSLWYGGLALLLLGFGLGADNGLGEISWQGVLFYPVMIGVFYILAKYVDKE